MRMSVRDDLIAARALIDTPEKWHRGSMASFDGKCLCAMGAIRNVLRAQGYTHWISRTPLYQNLRAALPRGFNQVPTFNDDPSTTHADIMALFDRAIAAAGAP